MIVRSGRSGRRREAQGSGDAGTAGQAQAGQTSQGLFAPGREPNSRPGAVTTVTLAIQVAAQADIACRATAELSPPVTNHTCPGLPSQVPGEPVPADRSRRGARHHVIVNIVGGYCSASPAWRFEQGGDLSDGFGTWADVPHRGARVAVPGLGHDQLQRDALLAEVSRRGVAQLVQLPPGVPGEQDPGAVVAEPGPSSRRAQVPGLRGGGRGRGGARSRTPARPGGRG